MANPELDRLLSQASDEISDWIRRAFETGVKQERGRLTALINAESPQPEPPPASYRQVHGALREPPLPESPQREPPPSPANYGRVIGAVRAALHAIPIGPGGVDAGSILKHLMHVAPDRHISDGQVRTCLKQLLDREEVIRVERGRFRLSRPASSGEEDPGDGAPGYLNLAAE